MTLTLGLISIGSISLCQAQVVTEVRKQGDHSYSLLIDGVPFKAVDNVLLNEQARTFDKLTAERDFANQEVARLDREKQLLVEKLTLTEQQRNDARNNLQDARVFIAQQKQLLEDETALRRNLGKFSPHPDVGGVLGKVFKVIDHPAFQLSWKLIPPAYQMMRCQ